MLIYEMTGSGQPGLPEKYTQMQCIVDERKKRDAEPAEASIRESFVQYKDHDDTTKVTFMDCSAAWFRDLRQGCWNKAVRSPHVSSVGKLLETRDANSRRPRSPGKKHIVTGVADALETMDSICQAPLWKWNLLPQDNIWYEQIVGLA
jgi:hypothetical protein